MTVRLIDSCTGKDIIGFFNPRTKRYYLFLFGYVDNKYRIIKHVTHLWIATWCTFASRSHKDWTKNLYINSNGVAEADITEWYKFTSDNEFERFIESKETEAFKCCIECFELFGLIPDEPQGAEYSTCTLYQFCESARITQDGELLKNKSWDVCR